MFDINASYYFMVDNELFGGTRFWLRANMEDNNINIGWRDVSVYNDRDVGSILNWEIA